MLHCCSKIRKEEISASFSPSVVGRNVSFLAINVDNIGALIRSEVNYQIIVMQHKFHSNMAAGI